MNLCQISQVLRLKAMSKIQYYEVHAFAHDTYGGNPAGVCPLEAWLPESQMQSIAASNNLSETAFMVSDNDGYAIRFFAPNEEVALCGHATLASAWVLFNKKGYQANEIIFYCKGGRLIVSKRADSLSMSLPALPSSPIMLNQALLAGLSTIPIETLKSTYGLLCVYESYQQIEQIKLNLSAFESFPYGGIILTAPGNKTDIYSRCFFPSCDVFEDPVTGSAHAALAVYWCNKLNKKTLSAEQGFHRRGTLSCEVVDDRVLITGQCRLYLEGCLWQ